MDQENDQLARLLDLVVRSLDCWRDWSRVAVVVGLLLCWTRGWSEMEVEAPKRTRPSCKRERAAAPWSASPDSAQEKGRLSSAAADPAWGTRPRLEEDPELLSWLLMHHQRRGKGRLRAGLGAAARTGRDLVWIASCCRRRAGELGCRLDL